MKIKSEMAPAPFNSNFSFVNHLVTVEKVFESLSLDCKRNTFTYLLDMIIQTVM